MKQNFSKLLVLFAALVVISCGEDETTPKTALSKINSVIPENYLLTIRGLRIDTYTGETPPDITGTYIISPNRLLGTNIPNDPQVNSLFADYTVSFTNQNMSDGSISFTGSGGLGENDSSSSAVIAGSGNDFTVYGQSISVDGPNSIVLGVIFTGTIENGVIKDLKRAFIVIDDSKGGSMSLKEGNGRVFQDADRTS